MKNVAGFDRRGWRTGFTCYRFAIPDFAGRTGKAIYNDVDQIYLADPALLFDLDLDGHGYLAIDARDTSVMLIDCEKMLPWWNRAAASAHGAKGPLTSKPAEEPGLWGELDGTGTRATSNMSRGGPSACTTRPCTSSPGTRSPRPTPTTRTRSAYLWHDLERGADAAGFEVFTPNAPSPGFARPGLEPAAEAPAGRPSPIRGGRPVRRPGADAAPAHRAWTGATKPSWRPPLAPVRHDFARARGRLLRRSASTPSSPPASSSAFLVPTRTGCCASCSPRPSARWCCGSPCRRGGRRQRGLVAPPGRGDRGALPQGQLGAGRGRRLPAGLDLRSTPPRSGASTAGAEPAGLGADRRGRGRRPAGRGASARRSAGRFEEKRLAFGPLAGCAVGCSAPRPAARSGAARRRWHHPGPTS